MNVFRTVQDMMVEYLLYQQFVQPFMKPLRLNAYFDEAQHHGNNYNAYVDGANYIAPYGGGRR